MASEAPANRITQRKTLDREARRALIISSARRIAEAEGWPSVTIRRLADEISYSQPVLYAHFENREAILAAVAIEGFAELGLAMESARRRVKRGSTIAAVAAAYLEFAAQSPALAEVMFSVHLTVAFDDPATPQELRFAFAQFTELFPGPKSRAELLSELFWASLYGIAELTRTGRFPRVRQKERLRALVQLFEAKGAGNTQ